MARRPGPDLGASTQSPGVSGWCLGTQHAECSYRACTCTRCAPDVHHSRAGQAPRALSIHDTGPVGEDALAGSAEHAA